MTLSSRNGAAFILSFLPLTFAFDSISAPSSIPADSPTNISITNDIGSYKSQDSIFDAYRVYLSIQPPGWNPFPACWLVSAVDISVTSPNISIPASVGPSASNYSIVTMEFNDDSNSPYQYTKSFNFTGGNGSWTQYEVDGHGFFSPDAVPCESYNCVRNCSEVFYPGEYLGPGVGYLENQLNCMEACPGVEYPTFDQLVSDGGSFASRVSALATKTSGSPTGSPAVATNTPTSGGARSVSYTVVSASGVYNATNFWVFWAAMLNIYAIIVNGFF